MFVNKRYCFLLWMLLFGCAAGNFDDAFEAVDSNSKHDYVDPHSFYYSKHDQKEVKKAISSVRERSLSKDCKEVYNDCINGKVKDIPDELFSRRLINRLLSITTFEEDDDFFVGNIVIELTKSELTKLKNFGLGKVTVREVDSMISSVFRAPKTTVFLDAYSFFHGFTLKTHGAYSSYIWPNKELIFAFIAVVQITWMLVRTRWTYFKIFMIFFVAVFIVSCVITYLQLLKEAEIKLTVKQFRLTEMPVDCQPHKMSWYHKLSSLFSTSDSCAEYYEAVMEDHRFHVTPAQVVSRVIATLVLEPAGALGTAFGSFVHGATAHLPSFVRWFAQPLLLTAIIAAIIMGMVFVLSSSVQSLALNFFTSLRHSGTRHSHQDLRNITSKGMREPIEVILNLKVSTDIAGPLAVTHTGDTSQQLSCNESKKFQKKLEEFAGGDADQPTSQLAEEELGKKSSKIDDNGKMHEITHAGGDAGSENSGGVRRNLVVSEVTDSDNCNGCMF